MAEKVLKLQIVVDEDGKARRAVTDLETGIQRIEGTASSHTRTTVKQAAAVEDLGGRMRVTAKTVDDLTGHTDKLDRGMQSLSKATLQIGTTAAIVDPRMAGLGRAMTMASNGAGALGVAIGGLALVAAAEIAFLKESADLYLKKSNLLKEHQPHIDELRGKWEALLYVTGAGLVGSGQHFDSWIDLVGDGLVMLVADKILPAIAAWNQLRAAMLNETPDPRPRRGPGSDVKLPGPSPWDISRRQDPDDLAASIRLMAAFDAAEKLALETAKALRNEHVGLRQELINIETASKAAFADEIFASYRANMASIKTIALGIRDDFAAAVLSGQALQQFKLNERTDRAISEIDPRASNAGDLAAKLQAQRELALLMMKKDSEGMTDELVMQLRVFQEKWGEVVGDLPVQFQTAIPEITKASATMRDTIVSDLDATGAAAAQTFTMIAVQAKSSLELLQEAQMMDMDAERNLQRGDPSGIGFWQRQGAASKRKLAFERSRYGFAEGGIVPRYFDTGGLARGTDTVPAMLTPGELVLNVAQQKNVAGAMGGITVQIDARGANFSDDAALDRLADKVQQKLATIAARVG